jgi:hypothetical protein
MSKLCHGNVWRRALSPIEHFLFPRVARERDKRGARFGAGCVNFGIIGNAIVYKNYKSVCRAAEGFLCTKLPDRVFSVRIFFGKALSGAA